MKRTERALRKMELCVQTRAELKEKSFAETMKVPIKRFLEQFRVIRRALWHPEVPWYAKAVAGCAVLYVVSPIQLIPNFIPIIGQMDDVLVVSLGIRFLRRCVPPHILEECQKESNAPVIPTIPVVPVADAVPGSKS
jgi:uncharacterized membrane protein YkvA (DUF1232 family)